MQKQRLKTDFFATKGNFVLFSKKNQEREKTFLGETPAKSHKNMFYILIFGEKLFFFNDEKGEMIEKEGEEEKTNHFRSFCF